VIFFVTLALAALLLAIAAFWTWNWLSGIAGLCIMAGTLGSAWLRRRQRTSDGLSK
jgi:hypothetical protein